MMHLFRKMSCVVTAPNRRFPDRNDVPSTLQGFRSGFQIPPLSKAQRNIERGNEDHVARMSRSNLEYGAIIDADDENDGDLVRFLISFHLLISRDKLILNSMALIHPEEIRANLVDFTAQEDLGKPQRNAPPRSPC